MKSKISSPEKPDSLEEKILVEFDERFVKPYPISDPSVDCRIAKDFLSSAITKIVERCIGELPKEKYAIAKPGRIEDQIEELNLESKYSFGFNEAISQAKSNLSKL